MTEEEELKQLEEEVAKLIEERIRELKKFVGITPAESKQEKNSG
jgi:hypothetical protein